jgi:hypothetical protein
MLFAFVADFQPNTTPQQRDAALARRAAWRFPAGTKVVAEFWSFGNSPLVYTVVEANDPKAVWQLSADWNDVFDIRIIPVITSEFGLAHGQEVFEKRPR